MIETLGTILLWVLAVILILAYPFSEFARGMATNPSQHAPSRGALFASMGGLVLAILLISGCATFGSAPVYGEIPECELLIPPQLKEDVPSVEIPDSEDAEPWQKAFVGQTGQLDKANERPDAIDHIYAGCLQMHRNALKRAKRGFFGRLFS